MKKKSVLGILIAIMAISVASGALLDKYVSITNTADIEQAVVFEDGNTEKEFTYSGVAGDTMCDSFVLKNRAEVVAPVSLETSYEPDGDGIYTGYAELEEVSGVQTQEQTWGDGLKNLSDPLEVSVTYHQGYTVFKAEMPEDYSPDEDMMTFTFDKDMNGYADYQIQYNTNDENEWNYAEVNETTENWGDWQTIPDKFVVWKDNDTFALKVPLSEFVNEECSFKFGVDANGQNTGNGQALYPGPEYLWYNGDNYVSSDNYAEVSFTPIDPQLNLDAESATPVAVCNHFDVALEGDTYTITTDVNPAEE